MAWDKEVALGGIAITERPVWLGAIGADVMRSEEAKAYVQQWNGQDLAKIDTSSSQWMKFAVFATDPENQMAIASLGLLAKDISAAAISYMSRNISNEKLVTQIGKNNVSQKEQEPINKVVQNNQVTKFKTSEFLDAHYQKHSSELQQALNKENYSKHAYLQDANLVINEGIFVPELNGYVRLVGGKGTAKYAFTGVDRASGNITTFHLKTVSELARKAPSLKLDK